MPLAAFTFISPLLFCKLAPKLPAKEMANSQLSDAHETITTYDEEGGHEASPATDEGKAHVGTLGEDTESVRELKFGQHVCPEEFINVFTPMEFEEVSTFDTGTEALFGAQVSTNIKQDCTQQRQMYVVVMLCRSNSCGR